MIVCVNHSFRELEGVSVGIGRMKLMIDPNSQHNRINEHEWSPLLAEWMHICVLACVTYRHDGQLFMQWDLCT